MQLRGNNDRLMTDLFLPYLVLSCHCGQVILQPPVLSDCDLFVSPESSQFLLTGIQLSPQTGYLPLTAVKRPLQLTTRIVHWHNSLVSLLRRIHDFWKFVLNFKNNTYASELSMFATVSLTSLRVCSCVNARNSSSLTLMKQNSYVSYISKHSFLCQS